MLIPLETNNARTTFSCEIHVSNEVHPVLSEIGFYVMHISLPMGMQHPDGLMPATQRELGESLYNDFNTKEVSLKQTAEKRNRTNQPHILILNKFMEQANSI